MLAARQRGVGIVLDHVDDLVLVPKLLHMLKPGIVKLDMAIFAGEDLALVHGVIADLSEWARQCGARLVEMPYETALREWALPAVRYTAEKENRPCRSLISDQIFC